ncbi:MerR family transcriptional regulator [Actinocorallia lasiicapitis]
MLIGELSRRTGVGAHLLRYYEEQGLLAPGRGANGYRDYAEGSVLTVTQIRGLLDAGLSTEDIAYLLPCAQGRTPEFDPCDDLLALLRTRLRGIDDRIAALTETRSTLAAFISTTESRPPAGPC